MEKEGEPAGRRGEGEERAERRGEGEEREPSWWSTARRRVTTGRASGGYRSGGRGEATERGTGARRGGETAATAARERRGAGQPGGDGVEHRAGRFFLRLLGRNCAEQTSGKI